MGGLFGSRRRRERRPVFSPAEGMVSHDRYGKAYTRTRAGSIVRVPAEDHRGAFVRSLRNARDRMTTAREKGAR